MYVYIYIYIHIACEELRGDREVVMEAVRQTGLALRYAAEELKQTTYNSLAHTTTKHKHKRTHRIHDNTQY